MFQKYVFSSKFDELLFENFMNEIPKKKWSDNDTNEIFLNIW